MKFNLSQVYRIAHLCITLKCNRNQFKALALASHHFNIIKYLCKNCLVYIQCKGDIVVVDNNI